MNTETHDVETVKLYIPEAAADTQQIGRDDTILETICRRAAKDFGGFTIYDASGGWINDNGQLCDENVKVVEILAKRPRHSTAYWAKVNTRFIKRMTDESVVIATVGDRQITVSD